MVTKTNKNTKLNLKINYYILIGVLALILIVLSAIFFVVFGTRIRHVDYEKTEHAIQQNLDNQVHNIEDFFLHKMDSLEKVANLISECNNVQSDEAFNILTTFNSLNIQDNNGIADINGNYKNLTGETFNMSDRDYFKDAVNLKKTVLSNMMFSINTQTPTCVIASPIIKNDSVLGVVTGTFLRDTITEHINTSSFDDLGYLFIVDGSNKLITIENEELSLEINSFLNKNTSNNSVLTYKNNSDEKYYVSHKKCSVSNWNIVSVVSTEVSSFYVDKANSAALILIFEIISVFLCCAIIVYIAFMFNVKKSREKDWKFKLAMEQISNAYFEYDAKKDEITFNPEAINLLGLKVGTIKNPRENNELLKLFSHRITTNEFENLSTTKAYPNGMKIINFKSESSLSKGEENLTLAIKTTLLYENNNMDFAIGTFEDISADKKELEELYSRVNKDPLTNLYSREFIFNAVNATIKKHPRSIHAFMILDLDAFKQINDSFGHNIGDEVLIKVANSIKYLVRKSDFVGRIGGDEYIIFLPNIKNKNIAKEKAKQLTESVNTLPVSDTIQQNIEASIGIALYPNHSNNFDELYINADNALQEAKKQEFVRYALYGEIEKSELKSEIENNDANEQNSLLDLFHKEIVFNINTNTDYIKEIVSNALKNNEFEIYLQPKINLNNKCNSAEVLVRWNSSKYGFLQPLRFIGVFEKINMIEKLDYTILEKSIKQLAEWKKNNQFKDLNLSINQCVHLVTSMGYVQKVKSLLKNYKVNPKRITIEITERSALSSLRTINKIVKDLIHLGIRVSIDDFGSGYTSLNMLKTLNVSEIKLDKLFLDNNLETENKSRTIIKHLITLAHDLKINVVAEGVKLKEDAKYLIECGCDELQGFYFDKPMTIKKFEKKYSSK